ncbi:hypothetical protein TNCV_3478091 [Trichonephila clavipes]|nr:hypothetical protein TNCV_3478091 [Trichonephila clavipes]
MIAVCYEDLYQSQNSASEPLKKDVVFFMNKATVLKEKGLPFKDKVTIISQKGDEIWILGKISSELGHFVIAELLESVCDTPGLEVSPAYLPDISPIENVWDLEGQRPARDPRPAASKDELLLGIQAIWNSIPQADVQNLFNCMPVI